MKFELTERMSQDGRRLRDRPMFAQEQRFAFLEGAAPEMSVRTAWLAGTRLCRVRSTGHRIALAEPAHVTLLAPRTGRLVSDTSRGRFACAPGRVLVFAPNRRTTLALPDGERPYAADCVLVPLDMVLSGRAGAGALGPALEAACAEGPAQAALRSLLDYLFAEAGRPCGALASPPARAAAEALLAETLAARIAETDGADPRAEPDADARLVRQAEEILHARFDTALAMNALAAELGVSLRRLQYAYRRRRGTSPREALTRIRLDHARARLLAGPEGRTVSRIALDCGFAHLGRFAAAYAARFGEAPSQTLRGR